MKKIIVSFVMLVVMLSFNTVFACETQAQIDADKAEYQAQVDAVANGTFVFSTQEQSEMDAIKTKYDTDTAKVKADMEKAIADYTAKTPNPNCSPSQISYHVCPFDWNAPILGWQTAIDNAQRNNDGAVVNLTEQAKTGYMQQRVSRLFDKLQSDELCPTIQPVAPAPVVPTSIPQIKVVKKTAVKFVRTNENVVVPFAITTTEVKNAQGETIATQKVEAPVKHSWFSNLFLTVRSWF